MIEAIQHTRQPFFIIGIAKEIRKILNKDELIYKFYTDEGTILYFKTDIELENIYDPLLAATDRISGRVEYINPRKNNISISDIRYLKPSYRLK